MKQKRQINCPHTRVVTVPRNSIRSQNTTYRGMNYYAAKALKVPFPHSRCTVLVESGDRNRKHTVTHEIVERDIMSTGVKYREAHKVADAVENQCNITKAFKRNLKTGVKVEREHTKSIKVARRIALDHLAESPRYYDYLVKMEAAIRRDNRGRGRC